MFDIGWSELLVIAVVLIVVVGPKDLPPMLRTFGKMMTRFRKVAGDFRAQFDDALREADLDDVRQHIADAQKLNPAHSLREAMNPLRQMGNDIKADLQRSTSVERPPETTALPHPEAPAAEAAATTPSYTPQPVIAPAPVAISEAVADPVAASEKPKTPRKPRAKRELVATETPATQTVVEQMPPARAPRKPRVRAEARNVDASVPVVTEVVPVVTEVVPLVTEVLTPSAPARRSRAKAGAGDAPSVVEPAQVGLPAEGKPKRTRKAAAAADTVDTTTAQPSAAPHNLPATKEDDA